MLSKSSLNELLRQSKVHFENENFEACIEVLNAALKLEPGNQQARSLLNEAKQKDEDKRLQEELTIHVENLKQEAMNLFDKEKYEECLGIFKFLSEVDPGDRMIDDFKNISQQKLWEIETEQAIRNASIVESSTDSDNSNLEATAAPKKKEKLKNDVELARGLEKQVSESKILQKKSDKFPLKKEDSKNIDLAGYATRVGKSEDVTESKIKKVVGLLVVVVLVLVTITFGSIFYLEYKKKTVVKVVSSLNINSEPDGADVWINGILQGQTNFHLEPITAGNYDIRIEKAGFGSLHQMVIIEKGQKAKVAVKLEKLPNQVVEDVTFPSVVPAEPSVSPELQEKAKAYFDKGKLWESSLYCDAILEKDSKNEFALKLRKEIRKGFLQHAENAIKRKRWEDAQVTISIVLKMFPRDADANRLLKQLKADLNKIPQTEQNILNDKLKKNFNDLRQQISVSIGNANFFPPQKDNAIDLINQLKASLPNDPFVKEQLDQVQKSVIDQINRDFQFKDYDSAKMKIQHMQVFLPASPEIQRIKKILNVKIEENKKEELRKREEEAKKIESANPWLQKAEASFAAGKYVLPVNDNAVIYCNRVLSINSQNQQALALKKDSIDRALVRARALIQNNDFEVARQIYAVLFQFSRYESSFPVNSKDLSNEVRKLEIKVYPVIVDNGTNSCSGRLKINGYVISFIPTGICNENFNYKMNEIIIVRSVGVLRVLANNKTYNFKSSIAANEEDNKRKVEAIYQQLNNLMLKQKDSG